MTTKNENSFELSEEYKTIMDEMLQQEEAGSAQYISLDEMINELNLR